MITEDVQIDISDVASNKEVWFLETDTFDIETAEDQLDALGIRYRVLGDSDEFITALIATDPRGIAGFCLDFKIAPPSQHSSLYPNNGTDSCGGALVFRHHLRGQSGIEVLGQKRAHEFAQKRVAFLSNYADDHRLHQIAGDAGRQHHDFEVFSKSEVDADPSSWVHWIKNTLLYDDYCDQYFDHALTVTRLSEALTLPPKTILLVLGGSLFDTGKIELRESDNTFDTFCRTVPIQELFGKRDALDRFKHIIRIFSSLLSVYDDQDDAHQDLIAERKSLDEKSPLQIIVERGTSDIARLADAEDFRWGRL